MIRCGEYDSLAVSRSYPARWFPAFYNGAAAKVVDVTGVGNAFLGAFAVMLATVSDLTEAVITSSVVASLAIEQIGLPQRGFLDGVETWNGADVLSRTNEYRARIGN